MNVKTLIQSKPGFHREPVNPEASFGEILNVSEFFYDTIQGENFIGYPAAFLRLQHCTLDCTWCDTSEVWREGNPYSFDELFQMIESDLIDKLFAGQHLVLTGGSPLKQQYQLIMFLKRFQSKYNFLPFIEIENECTIMPSHILTNYISCWNNSPKLSNSGNSEHARYKPEILKVLSKLNNSWFKFVLTCKEDWEEIQMDFLDKNLIRKNQIVIMPQGQTRTEIEANREMVVDMAIEHNVRYCPREHIVIWDKKTGI